MAQTISLPIPQTPQYLTLPEHMYVWQLYGPNHAFPYDVPVNAIIQLQTVGPTIRPALELSWERSGPILSYLKQDPLTGQWLPTIIDAGKYQGIVVW
jgi:hypothetical protein